MRSSRDGSRWTPRLRLTLLCLLGFALLTVGVRLGLTDDLDRQTLSRAQTFASQPLDVVASLVTVTGRVELTALLACVLAFLWTRREGPAGWAPLALFVAVALEVGLKSLVPHPAPPSSALRDLNFLQIWRSDAPYAYPSGHVTRTTFLAVLVAERVPWSRPLVLVYVVLVAVTRIYVGAHWLSDVLGGLFLGLSFALAATPTAMTAGRAMARLRK